MRYDALFTFIFSPRGGTPAASMPDPTPKEEKNRRFDRLVALQNRISEEKHRAYIGRTFRVLIDGREENNNGTFSDNGGPASKPSENPQDANGKPGGVVIAEVAPGAQDPLL